MTSRNALLAAVCLTLMTACGGDTSGGNGGPTGPGGGSGSARFATVRKLQPRIGTGTIGRLQATNDALYFDVLDNGLTVWRHYGDTVFAKFDAKGRPINSWTPSSLDIEPPRQFSIYWTGGQMTSDLKQLRFGYHSFGPIGVPDEELWNFQPMIQFVVPTTSTAVTSRLVWGIADWGSVYREDRFVSVDTSTGQWFEAIYTEQEPFTDALMGISAAAEGYLYIGGMDLHEVGASGGYRKIALPGSAQLVHRLIYDGKDLWIGRGLDVFRMPIYPQRGEPTLAATVDGQFCVWRGQIYTSIGSVYTTGLGAKKESWLTDKPLAQLTVEEHKKLQALVPAGGLGSFTCSAFAASPRLYATAMDASFRPTLLYEMIPVQ